MSSELRVVTYVNKKKETSNFPLSSALDSSNQVKFLRIKLKRKWQNDWNIQKIF